MTAKRALITGGSRGIGAAIATRLATDGFRVVLTYRSRAEAAEQVASTIRAAGGQADVVGFDVADGEAVAAALEGLGIDDDPFQVVVNNAGITADAVLGGMSFEKWEAVTRTTLDGFFHVTKRCLLPMLRTRWGRVINISSVSGLVGQRGQVNYSAAKAGLIGATKALAQEVGRKGITVNAVAPGLIETEMIEGAPVDQMLPAIPMRRLGTPVEVAGVVSFLASEDASYVTGQVIGVSGGLG